MNHTGFDGHWRRSKAKERKHEDAAMVSGADSLGGDGRRWWKDAGFAIGKRACICSAAKTVRRPSGALWRSARAAKAGEKKMDAGRVGWKPAWRKWRRWTAWAVSWKTNPWRCIG